MTEYKSNKFHKFVSPGKFLSYLMEFNFVVIFEDYEFFLCYDITRVANLVSTISLVCKFSSLEEVIGIKAFLLRGKPLWRFVSLSLFFSF